MREDFVDAMTAASLVACLTSITTEVVDLSLGEVAIHQYLRAEVGPALQQAFDEEQKRSSRTVVLVVVFMAVGARRS